MDELSAATAIAKVGIHVVTKVIDKFLIPAVDRAFEAKAANTKRITLFSSYLKKVYDKHLFLSTIVLQANRKLRDLYVPLTLVSWNHQVRTLVDRYPSELLAESKNIAIIDAAGMGKSTLSKYILLECIDNLEAVPVFFELRRMRSTKSVLEQISEDISNDKDKIEPDDCARIFLEGSFLFIFDGYDEMPLAEKSECIRLLQNFMSTYKDSGSFIITSRPDDTLNNFAKFINHHIQPLLREEAFLLIRKYDENGTVSENLVEELQHSNSVDEFLRNPLMASLLFRAYEFKSVIPLKRHLFYRQVYDALFEVHDLSKEGGFQREKHSGLDTDDFHRVMRAVGFVSFKSGRVEVTRDEFSALIDQARAYVQDIVFKTSDLIRDVLSVVPLFIRDGNYIRWSHKSLQDYFCAQFVNMDVRDQGKFFERFSNQANVSRCANILLILAESNPRCTKLYLAKKVYQEILDSTAGCSSDDEFTIAVACELTDVLVATEAKGTESIRSHSTIYQWASTMESGLSLTVTPTHIGLLFSLLVQSHVYPFKEWLMLDASTAIFDSAKPLMRDDRVSLNDLRNQAEAPNALVKFLVEAATMHLEALPTRQRLSEQLALIREDESRFSADVLFDGL